MRIREVMTLDVESICPEATVHEAAARMKARNIGMLPVCENDRLVGVITDRDITVRCTAEGHAPQSVLVRDVMTPEVFSCFDDQLVSEASLVMQEQKIRRLIVLNRDRRLVGLVSLDDLAVQTHDEELAGVTLEGVSEGQR